MTRVLEGWSRKWYGFFRSGSEPLDERPLLSETIDKAWQPSDKARLVDYLRDAPYVFRALEPKALVCPLCGVKVLDDNMEHKTDNTWLWAGPLYHLVEKHCVVLPQEFADHIRAQGYCPPHTLIVEPDQLEWP